MHPKYHVLISGVFSAGIYGLTKSAELSSAAFVTGVLTDLDHVSDYLKQHPGSRNVSHFVKTCMDSKIKLVYLVFHSLELLIPLTIMFYYTKSVWILGVNIGLTLHILSDYIFNKATTPFSYFLIFRWIKRFESEKVFGVISNNK
ncbi:MAG: hypothetical protein JW871_00930 [Endomicrobiales bacterium]|nr:hypothetical protein [Endomicrobiales bacterium]